ITEDNRLSAKDMFTRKELISLQQDFPLEMREKGFDVERGEGSEKKHLSPQAFKEKQDLEVEVEQLSNVKTHLKTKVVETHNQLQQTTNYIEKQNETLQKIQQQFLSLDKKIKEKKQEFETFRNQIPDKPVSMSYLREETKTEVTTKLFGKPEITEKKTGNIVVTREQWRDMTEKVNAAVIVKKDYERLQKTDLVKENQSLREDNKYLEETIEGNNLALKHSYKQNRKLEEVNKELHTEIGSLKAHIRDLQMNIKVLYQHTKKVFKEQFKTFRGLIKNELDMKGVDNQFEREHEREKKREVSRSRGYDMER
ncbi:plasmid recombination protein, partial [Bacillus paranthracis]|uniref:plasmid recombination protein n=1 Tax=Bacillus paranthracis TaxID=2026186 RepID=UPI002E1DAAB5|nr:plasmid recombination protein [Bacillus paranthracis]